MAATTIPFSLISGELAVSNLTAGTPSQQLGTNASNSVVWSNGWTSIINSDISIGSPTTVSIFAGIDSSDVSTIEIGLVSVSTNSDNIGLRIQIGPVAGLTTTGYDGVSSTFNSTMESTISYSSGFDLCTSTDQDAADVTHASITLTHITSNAWFFTCKGGNTGGADTDAFIGTGTVTLSGLLDLVSLTTTDGLATFDSGYFVARYK